MLRNQNFSLAPGASLPIMVQGNYIYWDTATGTDQRLQIKTGNGGDDVIIRPGMDVEFSEQKARIDLYNPTAAQIDGVLILGSGKVTNRLLSGSVDVGNYPADQGVHFVAPQSVIQTSRSGQAARSGKTFGGHCWMTTSAANYDVPLLLVNPVGSAATLFVKSWFAEWDAPGVAASAFTLTKWAFTGAAAGSASPIGDAALTAAAVGYSMEPGTARNQTATAWATAQGFTIGLGAQADMKMATTAGEIARDWDGVLILQPGQMLIGEINLAAAANVSQSVVWWEE